MSEIWESIKHFCLFVPESSIRNLNTRPKIGKSSSNFALLCRLFSSIFNSLQHDKGSQCEKFNWNLNLSSNKRKLNSKPIEIRVVLTQYCCRPSSWCYRRESYRPDWHAADRFCHSSAQAKRRQGHGLLPSRRAPLDCVSRLYGRLRCRFYEREEISVI